MKQKSYNSKVLERFEMSDCKSKPATSEQRLEFGNETPIDPRRYREAMGGLVYML